ncbi:hypothetical protein O181_121505, partial [Austropuccinia psidii MF-1]|nr:hypothetical protein [Austropuccinia psidii MF-1]
MPVKHSPPAKNTRSQRDQAFLTPTERDPLDRTPSVHQLSAYLDRGPQMDGAAPSRRGGMKLRKAEDEEAEGFEETEVVVWYSIPFFHQAQDHSTPKTAVNPAYRQTYTQILHQKGQFYSKKLDLTHKTMAQAPKGS